MAREPFASPEWRSRHEGGWRRVTSPGRRLLLVGAAATALGAGGVAAAVVMGDGQALPPRLRLATGPKGAVYLQVGGDLAQAVQAYSPSTTVQVRPTAATVENLRLLSLGRVDLGFASLDAAAMDGEIRKGIITGLCRVYDSGLHLVVLRESPIRTPRDLEGMRISLGGSGSGTEFTARLLLSVLGLERTQLVTMGQTPSMAALKQGRIDAAFSLTGFPTPAIAELADERPIRLIPLGTYFGDMDRSVPRAYAPAPIPDGTYRGVPTTDTVLVPNVLLARPGLPDDVVAMVMGALFAKESRKYWVTPDSKRINLGMATVTGAATLHPAAKSWLDRHR